MRSVKYVDGPVSRNKTTYHVTHGSKEAALEAALENKDGWYTWGGDSGHTGAVRYNEKGFTVRDDNLEIDSNLRPA
jgi:hypothetical protein